MKVSFGLIASAANVAQGQMLNVLGQFDTVISDEWPAKISAMYVARIVWGRADDGPHKLGIRFVDEDGQLLGPPLATPVTCKTQDGVHPGGTNILLNVNFVFPHPGEYSLQVYLDGQQVHETAIYVREETPGDAG